MAVVIAHPHTTMGGRPLDKTLMVGIERTTFGDYFKATLATAVFRLVRIEDLRMRGMLLATPWAIVAIRRTFARDTGVYYRTFPRRLSE